MHNKELLIIDMSNEQGYVTWATYQHKYSIIQSITKELTSEINNNEKSGKNQSEELIRTSASHVTQVTRHNEYLVQALEMARREISGDYNHITDIAINIGPGSFTGLRIALSFARGLQAGIPQCNIIGIDIMQLWSYIHLTQRPLLIVNDARSNRFYACLRTEGTYQRTLEKDILDETAEHIIAYVQDNSNTPHLYVSGLAQEKFLTQAKNITHNIDFLHTKNITLQTVSTAFLDICLESCIQDINYLTEESTPLYVRQHI